MQHCEPNPQNPGSKTAPAPVLADLVHDFHRSAGIEEHDLKSARELVESGAQLRRANLPMKVALFAHYQIMLEAIWTKVSRWTQKNSGCCGLLDTALLKDLSDPKFLLAAGRDRPVPADAEKLIKPLTVEQVGALKARLKTLPEDAALRELSTKLGDTFKAFIYLFEVEQLNGVDPLLSTNGKVRLFDQYRDLARQEKADTIRTLTNCSRAAAEREGRSALGWNPLTLILADGVSTGAETIFIFPKDHRSALYVMPRLHEAYVNPAINLFIRESKTDTGAPRPTQELLKNSFDALRAPQCPFRGEVNAKLREGPINSSMTKVAPGCPAFGSPAFAGFINWAKQARQLFFDSPFTAQKPEEKSASQPLS
jgi:hypothetical protein